MPQTEVTTVILRFRDLATAQGQTLALHRAIRDEHGFVWWGWWNKFGEQVPSELFARLKMEALGAPQDWFLFDSGQNRLYRARCSDVVWNEDARQRIPSPDPGTTPEYYRDQRYFAWFRLTELPNDPVNAD